MTTPDEPLIRLPDGTVKQLNPFTGTEVWTVPGRGNRPLAPASDPAPIDASAHGRHCAFCPDRYLETPPEKSRRVLRDDGWHTLTGLTAEEYHDTVAQFRLIPNLFEIVSLRYWMINQGFRFSPAELRRRRDYLATPAGREHVRRLIEAHRPALVDAGPVEVMQDSLLGGFHDLVVARRHFVDGATLDHELASAGTLTPDEHAQYLDVTVTAARNLFSGNRYLRNVVIFQNWLRPAGASFDHLHKQLVGIDEYGRWREAEIQRLRADPDLFQRTGPDLIARHDLAVAENEHAIAFAGIGHRYPSLEVWTKRMDVRLDDLSVEELRGFSDLVHACHAATGPLVPCNEEWHYRPPALDLAMPLRVVLKWRISTPAGFEGGSRIYINTLDPWNVRDRARRALHQLSHAAAIGAGITVHGRYV